MTQVQRHKGKLSINFHLNLTKWKQFNLQYKYFSGTCICTLLCNFFLFLPKFEHTYLSFLLLNFQNRLITLTLMHFRGIID